MEKYSYKMETKNGETINEHDVKFSLNKLMNRYPDQVPVLKRAIEDGHIDGRVFASTDRWDNDCGCLIGHVAMDRFGCYGGGFKQQFKAHAAAALVKIQLGHVHTRTGSEPFEMFITGVVPGHTPKNNQHLEVLMHYIEQWEGEQLAKKFANHVKVTKGNQDEEVSNESHTELSSVIRSFSASRR